MMTISVAIKRDQESLDLPLPSYATTHSAGVDLLASTTTNITIKPGERKLIATGISIALPDGYEAQVRPRSGLALKFGITVLNSPGTIDADYRGPVGVILVNLGNEDFIVERGMRIAQMVLAKVERISFETVSELPETIRGAGGFGSTGS